MGTMPTNYANVKEEVKKQQNIDCLLSVWKYPSTKTEHLQKPINGFSWQTN